MAWNVPTVLDEMPGSTLILNIIVCGKTLLGKPILRSNLLSLAAFLDLFENPKDSLFLRKQKALNFQMSQKFERIFF